MVQQSIAQIFKRELSARVVVPGDPDYDKSRSIFNSRIDKFPQVIVYCRETTDVVETLNLSRQLLPRVAIRSGGCSFVGFCVNDGGVVLDVSQMKKIALDPAGLTVDVEAGVTMGELYAAILEHRLFVPGGECPMVGVAGLTLGGGFSLLSRQYGLACDNLLQAEMVDAAGRLCTVSATSNPDLFWALRGGGGGNFGVATSFKFALHPLPEKIWGGVIGWPIDQAKEVFLQFQELLGQDLPEALGITCAMITSKNEPLLLALPIFVGPINEGKEVISKLTSLGEPALKDLQEWTLGPYLKTHFPGVTQRMWEYAKSGFFSEPLVGEALDIMVEACQNCPTSESAMTFEFCGGAVNRVPRNETAFPHRDDFLLFGAFADGVKSDNMTQARQWLDALYAGLKPYFRGQHYRNYPDLSLKDWQDGYYGDHYARLVEVKRRYDPSGLFCFAQGVSCET